MKKILLFSSLFFFFLGYSQALDTAFNETGIVTSSFLNSQSSESMILSEMQADGKMVYLGNYYENNSISGGLAGIYIARYNTNGSLDTTFNSCGYRIFKNDYDTVSVLNIPTHNFYDLKLQSDEKILVSGDSFLYRFNTDGSYDSTFGTNGHIQITYNNTKIQFGTIRIQPDNKIVLNNNSDSTIIVRLNSDGSPDTTFSNDGIVVLNYGSPFGEKINDIAIQPDGKLIVEVVTFSFTNNYRSITVRLNNDGSSDTSFGTNGIATPLSTLYFGFHSYIELQPDGKILVIGPFTSRLSIARYNNNGVLDTSFDTDGIVNLNNSSSSCEIKNVKSLDDGKIIALVSENKDLTNNLSTTIFKIYKLNSNGSMDTSFATNGLFYSSQLYSNANSINIKSDGSITTSGSFVDYTNYIDDDSLLHRLITINLSANGMLQNTTVFNLKQNFNEFNGVIEQANGKIIAFYNSNKLVRYNLDGSIDTNFGTDGTIDLSDKISNKMIQQPDGNFLFYQTNYSKIYRRNIDGILDSSFGINGELSLPNIGFINKIYPTNDNKLFLLSTDYSYFIQKLNNDGTIDTSFALDNFDTSGFFGRFNLFDNNEGETSENMIIQSDNKIIIAVSLIGSNSAGFATGIIRLNPNGSLDTTFGTNGKIIIQENNYILPKKLYLLENDSFVINYDIGLGETKLYKYSNNGTLDTNFNNNSIINDTYNTNEIIVQPDFKILKSTNVNNQFTFERYDNVTGALDTTFGSNGIINTPIGLVSNIKQLTWLQNNTLLASGTSFDGTNEVITLARYVNLNLGNINFTNENTPFLVYPNPIQEETTFEYSLENNETVSIEIIDMQGRIVQTIFKNKELAQGNYKQKINVSNLNSSENYILKFSSSNRSESIKIIKK